jgi:uncharacterized protein YecE (DUF72 family)
MPKADCKVLVGTSGYSFDDWDGVFYPVGHPKGKRLDFYKDHFRVTEINSTYYRIPHPAVFYNMVKKVDGDFEFIIKTHRSFTHDRKELEEKSREFNEATKPVVDSGRLKGYIAQFPYSFKYAPQNLDYILRGKDLFREAPLFVEFRNVSWDRPEVYEALRANGIGFCSVDEPDLPGLFPSKAEATTEVGYIRLHGRNAADWWGGGGDRYNYLYSEKELKEWKSKIEDLKSKTNKIYLFFNNCHLGQAVRNARMFLDMMQLEMPQ